MDEFIEEYVLSKMHDVQRRLLMVRERKMAMANELLGKRTTSILPKSGLCERIFVTLHRLPPRTGVDYVSDVQMTVLPSVLGLTGAFRGLLETIPICRLGAPGQPVGHMNSDMQLCV